MIDTTTIYTGDSNVLIAPECLTSDSDVLDRFALKHGIPGIKLTSGASSALGRRDACEYHTIYIGPDSPITLTIRSVDGSSRITKVIINHPKLAYGHNGRLVTLDSQLEAIRARAEDLIAPFLADPSSVTRLMPWHPDSISYYSSIECPVHLPDPEGLLLERFSSMRHPRITKPMMNVKKETYRLKGAGGFKIISYNKTLESRSRIRKFGQQATQPNVLRIEVGFVRDFFNAYFPEHCFKEINKQDRLVGFTLKDLRQAFLACLGELKGVFKNDHTELKKGNARFLAELSMSHGIPLNDLLRLYEHCKGLKTSSIAQLRRDATRMKEALSPLAMNELLSPEALDNQPEIILPGLEDALAYFRSENGIDKSEDFRPPPPRPNTTTITNPTHQGHETNR